MQTNPFSTCFVRPGALEFRFSAEPTATTDNATNEAAREHAADGFVACWRQHAAAAIIGPHGTGKSTCLQTLLPHWQSYFDQIDSVHLSTSDRSAAAIPARWLAAGGLAAERSRLLVIDGFEQLAWHQRKALVWRLRRRVRPFLGKRRPASDEPLVGDRWLVTAHRPQWGVATQLRTDWDDRIVQQITEERLQGLPESQQQTLRGAAARLAIRGRQTRNVRDYWFGLYDEFERLR